MLRQNCFLRFLHSIGCSFIANDGDKGMKIDRLLGIVMILLQKEKVTA
jgi:hypothetical protein